MNLSDIRNFNLSYDSVVIGRSLEAVAFAYYNNFPLLFIPGKMQKPHFFEVFAGDNKLEMWNKYIFLMSLNNLIPFSDLVNKIVINQDENQLKVITKHNFVCTIFYKNLYVLDINGLEGLPEEKEEEDVINQVVDYYKILNIRNKKYKNIKREDEKFIKRIIFYNKYVITISYLTMEQLDNFDYGSNIVRLALLDILNDGGIKGKYRQELNIWWDKREIFSLKLPAFKELKKNVKLLDPKIYNHYSTSKKYNNVSYNMNKMKELFFGK